MAFAAALLLISMKSTHFYLVKHTIGAMIGITVRDGIEQNEFIEMKIRGGLKQDGSLGSVATQNCSFEGIIFSSVNKTITKESIIMYDHLQTGFHKIKLTTTVPVVNKSRRDSTTRLSESRKPQETDACVYINGGKPGLAKVMNGANFNGTNCSAKNPKFRDTNNQRVRMKHIVPCTSLIPFQGGHPIYIFPYLYVSFMVVCIFCMFLHVQTIYWSFHTNLSKDF